MSERARVLMLSPHFPPDASAAAHRVRLLAPHLPGHGWEPTVLTVDPRDYEGPVDEALAALVPSSVRVVRARAWPARWTRAVGIGDLGLRALRGLGRAARRLLREEPFDAVFVTIYPTYPALLGPGLARRHRLPFVLDYQDPWVGEWGRSVGPRADGRPDLKSRLSRLLASRLEPRVVRAARAITAVSPGIFEAVRARYPEIAATPCEAIPLGGEPADLEHARRHPRPNAHFDPGDGQLHVVAVGTLLPLGGETLEALLRAVALLGRRRPDLYRRLRLHFFGTSNQARAGAPPRVLPVAAALGVLDRVTEVAPRIGYLDALTVQTQASALLALGSSERHYTASKIFPAVLAGRPLLAVYHERSTVVDVLRQVEGGAAVALVTYTDARRPGAHVEAISAELARLVDPPPAGPGRLPGLGAFSARALAGRLAGVLDRVGRPGAPVQAGSGR